MRHAEALEAEALAWVAREGALIGEHALIVSLKVRYPDQAHELDIIVPEALRRQLDGKVLAELFHAEHMRLYSFDERASPVQVTTVRLGVIGKVPPVALPAVPAAPPVAPSGVRRVRHGGRDVEAKVYDRAALGWGALVRGPAIVEQPDTTVFVLPGWQAEADRFGVLQLRRE